MAQNKKYSHLDSPEDTLNELISMHLRPDQAPRFDREVATTQEEVARKSTRPSPNNK